MRRLLLLSLLALGYQTASAQLVTESFGTGANAFTMDFVTIGNPNNVADTTGAPNPAGSVAYTYNLGKYEVSRKQIDKANSAGSLGITMYDMSSYGGNGVNKPATGINWFEATTYVNWLNTSQGYQAAYKFSGGIFQLWSPTDAGYNANNQIRNSQAKYVIASSNEWYKGAYGNPNGSWSKYPNGSDSAPKRVASGTDPNTAVYAEQNGPADITSAGGLSAYGTMGQGGNVWELNETPYDGINNPTSEDREYRGGSWNFYAQYFDSNAEFLASSNEGYPYSLVNGSMEPFDSYFPPFEASLGFRVASVPEPSTGLLVVLGLSGLLLKRRKTGTL
jgi:formylglycine-generating enzyme